ncbi:MAG: Ig-like domain-containing protein [Saccharofermentanales bacterium]
MLKKALGILLVFGILSIALSFAVPTFAAEPVFEIAQNFDGAGADAVFGTGDGGPALTMQLLPSDTALYGTGSLKFKNNATVGSDWVNALFDKAPKAPTIASPSGFFFRLETNAPEGVSMWPIATNNMWSNVWGATFTFVSYTGVVTANTNLLPANFSGYVFANLRGGQAPAAYEKFGMQMSTWASTGGAAHAHWGGSINFVDLVGYYSATAATATDEYKALAVAIDAANPRNPAVLRSITTGNYNDECLVDVKTTMIKVLDRPGPGDTFAWSIDNTAVATIDAAGVITPKKYGQATVTATLTLPDASKQVKTTKITIVKGSIYFTIEQYMGVENAVVTMESIFGIKPKINAKVTYNGFDNMVAWKVISGDASVENLSEGLPNASALDLHSAYITFKNSGKIVVRCSLVDAPTVYRDITFTVKSNPVTLESKISEAEGLGGEFTEAGYARLTKAIADANALLAKTGVEQATYDKMIDTLQFAMDNVFVEGTVSEPANSETESEGGNPQTSDNSAPIGYAAILSLLFAGVALSRKIIMNRQGR